MTGKVFRFFVGVMVLILVVPAAWSQISSGGTPPSFNLSPLDVPPTAPLPAVDVAAYLAEDALAGKDEPLRFGAPIDVAYNMESFGEWTLLPDGGRIWRLRFASPGAYSIGLLYDRWHIPDGADLFLYNDDRSHVIGAFTSFNNWINGTNITQPVQGAAVTLEYHEPANVREQGILSIWRVVHDYRDLYRIVRSLDGYGDSGSCNNNVNCAVGADWQNQKRGVAMILTSGGSRICSGSLVNNVRQDQTPYFLTANHCLGGETSWVFMFNYESPTCTNANGPTTQTVANATLRATNTASDFALLQLAASVPSSYNPYFNGWNRVDAAATNSVCIHHPAGDIKKISFDSNAPVSDYYLGYQGVASSHWKITQWDDGTTEGGSSGSPLFDQNHRITGQLHGGYASCTSLTSDWYGKFAMSWNYGSNSSSRLRDWLDPDNTSLTTLDGLNGGTASITVTSPNGGEMWYTGESKTITWTWSGVSGGVNIHLSRNGGSTWESLYTNITNDGSEAWTVSGALTSQARIRVQSYSTPSVRDSSNTNFTIAARTLTVTLPNGGENWTVGTMQNIMWSSQNVTGNVIIELNRSYSGGEWESLAPSTANDGSYEWMVTSPTTSAARIRITSENYPAVTDVSNANFSIVPGNLPQDLAHDPLDDQAPAVFTVTAWAGDDAGGFVVRFLYKLAAASLYDSLLMTATGYPDEYAASVGPLAEGTYDYFVKAIDAGGLVTATTEYSFQVGELCGVEQVFDDGVAEASHWSENAAYRWAMRFDAGPEPYVLCAGKIGVSANHPDITHSLLNVTVYLADGSGGMPGTILFDKTAGSIGNVIGGLAADPANWVIVLFRDAQGDPVVVSGDFYIAVGSAEPGHNEAFLHDTSSARSGRAVVYDPCEDVWMDERATHTSARAGNRMIRALGFPLAATTVVIYREGDDIRLDWNDVGAPYYRVYSAGMAEGPFTQFEGSTSNLFFVDSGAASESQKFYIVRLSSQP